MMFIPKSEFRGLGEVAETQRVRLSLGSKNGPGLNFRHGGAPVLGAVQRAEGPRSRGRHPCAAQNGLSSPPTGGAASSGFCRSARSRNSTSLAITS
jgi:hypothetical protein